MNTKLMIRAYAKINLGLKVLGRRPDGYHEIHTLLQSIDLADTLTLEGRSDGKIALDIEPDLGIPKEENLVFRAAQLIVRGVGCQEGVHLRLLKKIPIEAGLGGGSSDAAAALAGMDRLLQLNQSRGELMGWAAQLGGDVPFFFEGGLCEASGRGQLIRRLPPLLWDRYFVLLVPPARLPTPSVYREFDRLNASKPKAVKEDALSFVVGDEPPFISMANDLESAALSLSPQLVEYHKYLERAGAEFFGMSGSGPTYYAAFKHKEQAELFAKKADRSLPCEVFLTRPTNSGYEIIEED